MSQARRTRRPRRPGSYQLACFHPAPPQGAAEEGTTCHDAAKPSNIFLPGDRSMIRHVGMGALAGLLVILAVGAGCQSWDGHIVLGKYSTRPVYDAGIRTVRVPVFKNKTQVFQGNSGIENELTTVVIRSIEGRTPYKVVPENQDADTELTGVITAFTKGITNRNQLNEVREAETFLSVDIVWKDLRTGEILSQPRRRELDTPTAAFNLPPVGPPTVVPVRITSTGSFIPELGQSITSSRQVNFERVAQQIVQMMERPW